MIILDTHILVWLDQDIDALGPDARSMITQEHAKERLGISAISFWEIGMLIAKKRLKFSDRLTEYSAAKKVSSFQAVMPKAAFNANPVPTFK